jgi:hypothetical protein
MLVRLLRTRSSGVGDEFVEDGQAGEHGTEEEGRADPRPLAQRRR